MKKSLFTLLALVTSLASYAINFTVDGIGYTTTSSNTVSVSDGMNSSGDVVIPAEIEYDGMTFLVTSIGWGAFQCSDLKSINIPNSVTTIEDCAFQSSNLMSINIPEYMTSIGVSAFNNCTQLRYIISSAKNPCFLSDDAFDERAFAYVRLIVPVTSGEAYRIAPGWKNFANLSERVFNLGESPLLYEILSQEEHTLQISDCHGTIVGDVVIPETIEVEGDIYMVVNISRGVFSGSKGLTGIKIPNSVTSIGESVFSHCSGLSCIEIPSTLARIGESAFFHCTSLTSIDIPNSVTIIGKSAFEGCTGLTKVTIPSSISRIEYCTFKGCSGLASIEIPNTVTYIGTGAIEGCTGLTGITIPNSCITIDGWAFDGCTGLSELFIPNSVTSIGQCAFRRCTGLSSIVVEEKNTVYDSRENCNSIIETKSNTLIQGCNASFIPSTVVCIGGSAFEGCSGLIEIEIPESISTIGNGAFRNCSSLQSIISRATYPGSLSDNAFDKQVFENAILKVPYACTKTYRNADGWKKFVYIIEDDPNPDDPQPEGTSFLYSILSQENHTVEVYAKNIELCVGELVIPKTVGIRGEVYTVVKISESAFTGCTGLTKIEIPNTVCVIGESAFQGCSGLKSIELPENLTTIGQNAFYGCSGLTSISIPYMITAIGGYAFYDCTSLESIILNAENGFEIEYNTFSPATYENAVLYIYGPKEIAYTNYWNQFRQIEIPNERWNIEVVDEAEKTVGIGINHGWYDSFWWNPDERPKTIEIPETIFWRGETYSVTHIVDGGFSDLEDVKTITLPSTVVKIGDGAFSHCLKLTNINIPKSVTEIEDGAFSSCPELTSIKIPENVTRIGGGVFDSCEKLRKVTLPEGLTYLGENTFFNCQSLEEVHLPSKLEWIGNSAFGGCESLVKIDIPASVVSMGEEVFGSCKSLKEIVLPSKLERIEYGAFNLCESLAEIVIPASVVSIGASAFSGCSSLSSIYIPASVSVIGKSAFGNCESLININVSKDNTIYSDIDGVVYNKEQNKILIYPSGRGGLFVIPGNVNVIGAYAFANCSKMSEVEIPLSVKEIEEAAFLWCTGLTSINIPNSVTTIGKYAFRFCTELTYIVIPSSVNEIGEQAFNMEGRGRIEKIVSLNINPPSLEVVNNYWGGVYEVFAGNTLDTATLFVPKAAMSKYQEADSWKNFKNITTLPILTGTVVGECGTITVNGNTLVGQSVEMDVIPTESVTVKFFPEKACVLNSVMCNGEEMLSEVQGDSLLLLVGGDDIDLTVSFTNNYLAIKDIETTQRKKFTLPIELQNAASITATQFDLVLPEGFILVQDKDGMDMIELTERTTQRRHSVTASTQEDGSIRIVCTSMSNATFADNSGAILNIQLQLTGMVDAGNYTIALKNVLLSDISSESYTMPYTACHVIVNEGNIIMGDVNGDESINVGDIPALVSFIMGNARDTFVFKAADFNADNNVRVDDYVSLVNLILGGANIRPYTANRLPHFVDDENKVSLQVDPISIKPGEKKYISVNLNNVGDRFTALQFDMVLPEGISVAKEFDDYIVDLGSRTNSRKHDVSGLYQSDGSFRVVCGSQSNAEFAGESGDIVKVMVEADASMSDGFYSLEFKNITVARTDATSEICENFKTAITVGEPDGITIPYVDGDEGSWYSLEGKRSERKPMQQGIYVKDGKKLLIK